MPERERASRRPPKPRLPAKASVTNRTSGSGPKSRGRVTVAQLAEKLDQLSESVSTIEQALTPQERSEDVRAEENTLLNLVDAIVDRRTERALLPLAHLATILDRLVAATDPDDHPALIQESKVQLDLVLDALGLERVEPARGEASDPWLHEEVGIVEGSALAEGTIERLVRPGVRVRGGPLLIPALVAVSAGGADEAPP